MKFALSTEQRDFAHSLRDLLADAKAPQAIRAWSADDPSAGLALLHRLADAGVTGLAIDETFGGLGAHPVDLAVAFVEIGRAAVPGPIVETAAVLPALLGALTDTSLAAQWLPKLADGGAFGSVAVRPEVPFALDADIADLLLVADSGSVYLANAAERQHSIDPARRLFEVTLGDRSTDGAERAIAAAFDAGAFASAAQLLGAGRALLENTVEYAKNRNQFGRAIGSYQAIKHQLADVSVALEMATPLLHGAAVSMADGSSVAARDVSAAKIACGDAAYRAARTALQVHGAIGYTAEYDLSLWLTKVRALLTAWGTPSMHRSRVAASLRSAG